MVVSYQSAGFAPRLVAFLIDSLIQIALIIAAGYLIQLGLKYNAHTVIGLGSLLGAVGLVLIFIVTFFYATIFEMLWAGCTPGKKMTRLRVIMEDGRPIHFTASVVRNFMRIIDVGIIPVSPPIVLFCVPAFFSMAVSPRFQRLGDYAAGTLVVSEEPNTPFSLPGKRTLQPQQEQYLQFIRNLDRITQDEYRLIQRFVERRPDMELKVQAALGEALARPLLERMEIDIVLYYQMQFADILGAIEMQYAQQHGIL